MIRFIDIGDQIGEDDCFAFYNTVTDMFMSFNGDQTFYSQDDFIKAYNSQEHDYALDRFTGKILEKYKK